MKATSQEDAELLAVEPKVAALSLPGVEGGRLCHFISTMKIPPPLSS